MIFTTAWLMLRTSLKNPDFQKCSAIFTGSRCERGNGARRTSVCGAVVGGVSTVAALGPLPVLSVPSIWVSSWVVAPRWDCRSLLGCVYVAGSGGSLRAAGPVFYALWVLYIAHTRNIQVVSS